MKAINSIKAIALLATILLLVLVFVAGCEKEKLPVHETGTMMDIDSNVYKTIKIGNQWWMAEDLKVTHYRNGDAINQILTDTAEWAHDTIGAYCTYSSAGLSYNWYVIDKMVAPAGWHVPGDEEWRQLEEYLGMTREESGKTSWRGKEEGDKLKITGVDNWRPYQKVWANNETGFTARAGNCRLFDGRPGEPFGSYYAGFWWASTANASAAWYRHLDHKNSGIFRYYGPKAYGFSIRCVKD